MKTPDLNLGGSKTHPRGSALVSILLVSVLVASGMALSARWMGQMASENVHRTAAQRSMIQAESGVAFALETLRRPGTDMTQSPDSVLAPLTRVSADGKEGWSVSMQRTEEDLSVLELSATGYYLYRSGNLLIDGKRGQRSTISARVRVRSVGAFFAATPGALRIAYGTDLSNGVVQATELHFSPWNPTAAGKTRLRTAYFMSRIQPEWPAIGDLVDFHPDTPIPIRLPPTANLTAIEPSVIRTYAEWAGSDQLPANASLSGSFPSSEPSNAYKIIYVPGDVALGWTGSRSANLSVGENIVLCVAGVVTIHGDVRSTGQGWLGIVTPKDIVLADTAPNMLTIEATLVTGGVLRAESSTPRPSNARLWLTGGFYAQHGVALDGQWPNRLYAYRAPPEGMLLPFSVDVEMYSIEKGKHSQ